MYRMEAPWIRRVKLMILIVTMCSFKCEFCFEHGAPFKMCINSYPKHDGKPPMKSKSPYEIVVSQNQYSPSDNITVTLSSPDKRPFMGFQISAYLKSGDPEMIVGHFVETPNAAKKFSWPTFDGQRKNCITHHDNDEQTEIVAKWQAPPESAGDIIFRGSFVESFEVFWINAASKVIQATVPVQQENYTAEISNIFDPQLTLDDCGTTKGCLLWPRSCSTTDCQHAVTFSPNGQWIDFEMFGPSTGYLSLGFSKDIFMGDDETISCFSSDGQIFIQQGFNPSLYNDNLRTDDVSNVQLKDEDGVLYCRFRRPLVVSVLKVNDHADPPKASRAEFDLQESFYAQLAWGPVSSGSRVMSKHVALPLVTPSKVSFLENKVTYMGALPATIQAHAIMAFIAWMGLSGFAMIIGRHFRDGFGGKMVCGVKTWFQIHRLSLFLVAALTAASFVLIFIKVDGWRDSVTLHAAFGIAVMALVCFQISLGLIRPDPTSEKRPLFNWVHRIAGKLAHISAAVCMMLGVNITLLPKRLIYLETWVVAVWIGTQVVWEIILELIRCRKNKTAGEADISVRMDNINIKTGEDVQKEKQKDKVTSPASSSVSKLEIFLLLCYVISTVVLLALAITFLFLF